MLFLVASPIGHLADISLRALDTLRSSDAILCEDTRHSTRLLQHYSIEKPLISYHKFNEAEREAEILQRLRAGQQLSLLSDAGTPGIADPGERLVARCIQEGLQVTAIPGPCAVIQALLCSGLTTERFQFLGFVPKKNHERELFFQGALQYPGTSICYESPKRLCTSLHCIQELDAERTLVVARELTKTFETYHRGTAQDLLAFWATEKPRGECVLLINALHPREAKPERSLKEEVEHVQEQQGLTRKEAIHFVAQLRGLPKRAVYQAVHKEKENSC